MSRILVFGRDQKAQAEVTAQIDRGWMLNGNNLVTGGGSTTLELTSDQASKPFWQFGRMVLAAHEKLPNWAGVIDPPWQVSLPVVTAVYNPEYLLSLRSPDESVFLTGSVGAIAAKMVEMFNSLGDMFVRIGDTSQADPNPRQMTLDGRNYWDQLLTLLKRSRCEMRTRSERDSEGHLITYLDIARRIGVETGFLYSDGEQGNASFGDLTLDGPILNRVIGIGGESGKASRLRTNPFLDEASASLYGARSRVVQFQDVVEPSTLDTYSKNHLAFHASPHLALIMNIVDKGEAFLNARLGNTVLVHISQAHLPGGVRGFRGRGRILAMAYTESQNLLSARVELL